MNRRSAIVVSWCLAAVVAQAGERADLRHRVDDGMAVVDSLRRTVDPQAGLAFTEDLLAEAIAAGDSVAELGTLRLQSFWYRKFGDTPTALERGRRAVALAEALRDTARICGELYKMGLALSEVGRLAEADSLFRRVGMVAEARGDRAFQARAAMAVGRRALFSGRFDEAEAQLSKAATMTEKDSLLHDAALARNLLGITFSGLGRVDDARHAFLRARSLGESVDYPYAIMQATSNLAYLENRYGDPGIAAANYLAVYELAKEMGQVDQIVDAGTNYASTLLEIGRVDEAITLIREALATATDAGYLEAQCSAHVHLAHALLAQGHDGQSIAHLEQALQLSRRAEYVEGEVRALRDLAEARAAQGDLAGALALLEENEGRMAERALVTQYLPMQRTHGELLVASGRFREALPRLAGAEARAGEMGAHYMQMGILAALADCHRGLGDPEEAVAVLTRAAGIWESERSLPQEPQWREQRGSIGHKVYTELAQLIATTPADVPAEDRARRSFELVQRYKARTLWERMMGPGSEVPAVQYSPPDLATLQRDVLVPGEVLVDVYLGPARSMVYAVTPETCRAVELASSRDLGERLDLYVSLLADPSVDPETIILPEAGAALGEALLGELLAELSQAERILFLPDGALHLAPLSALALDDRGGAMAAVAQKEIVQVPSVAILARLRQTDPPPAGRLLALAGDANPKGQRLRGAWEEVRALDRTFRGVDARFGELPDLDRLSGVGVLHVAAHTTVDDQRPWRSGILLASAAPAEVPAAPDPAGVPLRSAPADSTGRYLRASDITRLDLDVSLAVLSGCESARGRATSGEGVLGLANAFLSARVQAVVATLWPVDDRSAAAFMGFFYRALADGRTVAGALRDAQNRMRADVSTRHPFHWAAFVVIGDGTQTISLRPRARISPTWWVAGALALLIAVTLPLFRRHRSTV